MICVVGIGGLQLTGIALTVVVLEAGVEGRRGAEAFAFAMIADKFTGGRNAAFLCFGMLETFPGLTRDAVWNAALL